MTTADAQTFLDRLRGSLNPVPPREALPAAADGSGTNIRELIPAAVLIPLVVRAEEVTVMLTRRAEHLPHHGGQVSFPGGQVEPADRDFTQTALREVHEEVGVACEYIRVAGALDIYCTGTGFQVVPIVGVLTPGFTLKVDTAEVAAVFEAPLSFLLDGSRYRQRSWTHQGITRTSHAIEYPPHLIWGATAAMLLNLRERLAGALYLRGSPCLSGPEIANFGKMVHH